MTKKQKVLFKYHIFILIYYHLNLSLQKFYLNII